MSCLLELGRRKGFVPPWLMVVARGCCLTRAIIATVAATMGTNHKNRGTSASE